MDEIQQQNASFFKELGCFLKPYSAKYIISILLSILAVGASIASYGLLGKIASLLFLETAVWNNVLLIALLIIGCKLINAIFMNWSTWISHKAAYSTLKDIRKAMINKMLRLPMGYFEVNGSGRLKSMFVDHIEGMEKTLAHVFPELTANLLVPLICIVWMFWVDWRLALIVLGWIIFGLSVSMGMMKGYQKKYAGQISAVKGMNQAVVEYVNGIEVIKNFGCTEKSYQKFHNAVYKHANYNIQWQQESQTYMALGMAIAPFSLFPVLIFGLIFWANGWLEAGTLFLVVILTFGIFKPLMNAMTYFDQLAGMGTNAKEIKEVLDYPELIRGNTQLPMATNIEFENVNFRYSDDGPDALQNISFNIPQGSMFALVGPSGSGKSTIAKLLAGFWDVTSGKIKIGNKSINEFSQEEINKLIAYVEQDTFLFDISIADNIRIGCPNTDIQNVIDASKNAGCHNFIMNLPDGYDTLAGVFGNKLSGGEKQRIAIARAMMKNAPIMILDEATASSDPENEAEIQQALSKAAKNKTLVVIAHRLNTIKNANQIAYVDKGKIIAIGTHEELMDNCVDYANLWNLTEGKNV